MSSVSAASSLAVGPFVESYESARERTGRACIREHLPPPRHPGYCQVLAELIRVDLEYRWSEGQPRSLADYLEEFPELKGREDLLAEIAYEEKRQSKFGMRNSECGITENEPIPNPATSSESSDLSPDSGFRIPNFTKTPPPRGELEAASVQLPDGAAEAARMFRLFQNSGRVDDSSSNPAAALPAEAAHVFADLQTSCPAAAARFFHAVNSFPEVGGQFAEFQLIAELGRGAFGRVFLARQGELADRLVALKIAADLTGEPQTLAQLQHTNIVPIYSFHRVGSLQAVCMPYFGSVTLADVVGGLSLQKSMPASGQHFVSTLHQRKQSTDSKLARNRSSSSASASTSVFDPPAADSEKKELAETVIECAEGRGATESLARLTHCSYVDAVLWLGARLADGLAHAHERGVTHRDLKPANVLLTDEGQPMLLDFNLAEDAHDPVSALRVGGTLPYMAPEHLAAFRGERSTIDARSDLYSLGILLFELLAGRHPFPSHPGPKSTILPEMIARRQEGAPGLRSFNPAVSPATEAIILKCLAAAPGERYPSAQALKEDLERQLADRPLRYATEPSPRERVRKWVRRNPRLTSTGFIAAAALALVLSVSVVGYGWWRENRQHQAVVQAETFQKRVKDHKAALGIGTTDRNSLGRALAESRRTLALYGLPEDAEWEKRPAFTRLPEPTRNQLRKEAGELLFLTARAMTPQPGAKASAEQRAETAQMSERAAACFPPEERPILFIARGEEVHARIGGWSNHSAKDPNQVIDRSPSPRKAYLTALELATRGQFKEALQFANQAIEAEPDQFAARSLLGHCYYGLGQYSYAQSAYDTCVALEPTSCWSLYNRGLARLRQKDYVGARADFDATLRLEPSFIQAYLNRGLARERLSDNAGAVEDYTRALQLGASEPRAYLARAQAYARLGNIKAADQDNRVVLKLIPTDEYGWIAHALVKFNRNPTAAMADLEKALRLNPTSRAALRCKAYILSEKMWRTAEAIRVLDSVIQLYPDYTEAKLDREKLQGRQVREGKAGLSRLIRENTSPERAVAPDKLSFDAFER